MAVVLEKIVLNSGVQGIVAADVSGSMGTNDGKITDNTSRFAFAEKKTIEIANAAAVHDPDGIDVIGFGQRIHKFWNTTPQAVSNLFSSFNGRLEGGTDTAGAVRTALKRAQDEGFAKTELHIITDGIPNSPDELIKAIVEAAKWAKTPEKFRIIFYQVGGDSGAAKFLKKLDNDLEPLTGGVDIVDRKRLEEVEFVAG